MANKKVEELQCGDIIVHSSEVLILISGITLQNAYAYFICSIPDKDWYFNKELISDYFYKSYRDIFNSSAKEDRIYKITFQGKEKDNVGIFTVDETDRFKNWYLKSQVANPKLPKLGNLSDLYKEYYSKKDYLTNGDKFELGRIYKTKSSRKYLVAIKPYFIGDVRFVNITKAMVDAIANNDNKTFVSLLEKDKEDSHYRRTISYSEKTKIKLYDTGLSISNWEILE